MMFFPKKPVFNQNSQPGNHAVDTINVVIQPVLAKHRWGKTRFIGLTFFGIGRCFDLNHNPMRDRHGNSLQCCRFKRYFTHNRNG